MLTDRQLRHAVTIRRSAAFRILAAEAHIDRALIQSYLALDVFLASFDEALLLIVIVTHETIISPPSLARSSASFGEAGPTP